MAKFIDLIRAGVLQLLILPRLWNNSQLDRFARLSRRYLEIYGQIGGQDAPFRPSMCREEGYDWTSWSQNVKDSFRSKVPFGFLREPTIAKTMVFGGLRDFDATSRRVDRVVSAYGEELSKELLREDCIGLPKITNAYYQTSANRAHHACHLASYQNAVNKSFFQCERIVEWGGGYGDMARLIRRLNNRVTFVIIDLPELCALQYIYLSSVEGGDSVNLLAHGTNPVPGKTNIVPVANVLQGKVEIRADAFISTWALTESPEEDQLFVLEKELFKADKILLAYKNDKSNFVKRRVSEMRCVVGPVNLLGIGDGNEYAFR
jgi:hypothetical protein